MPKSVFTDAYRSMLLALVEVRRGAGVTQVQLSERLGKPQPFISNIERGVRRLDVVEFYAIARALDRDPIGLFAEIVKSLPAKVEI